MLSLLCGLEARSVSPVLDRLVYSGEDPVNADHDLKGGYEQQGGLYCKCCSAPPSSGAGDGRNEGQTAGSTAEAAQGGEGQEQAEGGYRPKGDYGDGRSDDGHGGSSS